MQHSWEACRILCQELGLNLQSRLLLADMIALWAYKEKRAGCKISRWDLWRKSRSLTDWLTGGHNKKDELNHFTTKYWNVQTQILKLLEIIYHPGMMIHNILKEYQMMAFLEFCRQPFGSVQLHSLHSIWHLPALGTVWNCSSTCCFM